MSGAFDEEMGRSEPFTVPPSTAILALRNPEAELYLLTELIATNGWIDGVADRCRPADFAVSIHAKIFARMVAEAAAGRRVEAVTLDGVFREDPEWIAGQMLSKLSAADLNATRDRERTRGYADHILSLSQRRRLVAGFQDAIQSARTLEVPLEETIRDADEAMALISDASAEPDQATAGEYADRAIATFGKPVRGIRSALIASLDEITGTVRHGDQLVLAGGTGMGKSATAGSYALGTALSGGGVLFVSQEMSGDQLIRRMMADMTFHLGSPVPHRAIRDGTVRQEDQWSVFRARDKLHELPIELLDISGLTIAKLRRRIRKQKRRFAARGQTLDLVIIDYLQLMQGSRPGMTPYEAATEISKGLKQLAREEDVVMLTLAQLNRSYEKRQTKRPEKSDLRDSGQIEQDADYIVLLHREEVVLLTEEPVGKPKDGIEYTDWKNKIDQVRGVIEFIVPKCRHGEPGKALGWFHGKYQAVRGSVVGRSNG